MAIDKVAPSVDNHGMFRIHQFPAPEAVAAVDGSGRSAAPGGVGPANTGYARKGGDPVDSSQRVFMEVATS